MVNQKASITESVLVRVAVRVVLALAVMGPILLAVAYVRHVFGNGLAFLVFLFGVGWAAFIVEHVSVYVFERYGYE